MLHFSFIFWRYWFHSLQLQLKPGFDYNNSGITYNAGIEKKKKAFFTECILYQAMAIITVYFTFEKNVTKLT